MMNAVVVLVLLLSFSSSAKGFSTLDAASRGADLLQMNAGSVQKNSCRREFLTNSFIAGGGLLATGTPANAVERAVGGAELACREAGNCLEKGEWDGAVGWNWGAKERCDPSDPRCGSDGILRDAPPSGEPVPTLSSRVTHEVTMSLTVGRGESGTIKFGLFGEATPKTVQELVDFLSPGGLATSSKLLFEDGYGLVSAPVSMAKGYGLLTGIVPQKTLSFGIPSQAAAFAKSRGSSKAGDNFSPQPRPKGQLKGESSARPHDAAGLISVPGPGLGYASNGPDDEAYANAFEITAAPLPALDKDGRKVVGQILDQESMAFLARLASLPTRKGIKGVIPGLNSGPPLLKISVVGVTVQPVQSAPVNEETV